MKYVLTGGHLTPALCFSQTLLHHGDQVLIIGSYPSTSIEANEFGKLNLSYYSITLVKYRRHQPLTSLFRLPKLILAISQSLSLLKQHRPDKVVVFGGFTAVPVAIAAKILKIPCYLHEQTRAPGLANRLISPLVDGCAYSYKETAQALHCRRQQFTGNLIRSDIWQPPHATDLNLDLQLPILFITGGNQGSQVILDALTPLVSTLASSYQLVVQTGQASFNSPPHVSRLLVKPWYSAPQMAWLLHHAHLIISRGGANTLAEIMIAGTPAIIIPIPNSASGEQQRNANTIADQQAGLVLNQTELSPQSLQAAIKTIETDYSRFRSSAAKLAKLQQPQAAELLYQFVNS